MMLPPTLDIATLREVYGSGRLTPVDVVAALYRRIRSCEDQAIWISLVPEDEAIAAAGRTDVSLPLGGIPFAVKDNIDVAGMPTTAACAAYAYTARESAHAVQRLLDAGAILIGKTNLDQFATGLVGVRSPYGVPGCAFDPAYIPGGSSSGSALAVARSQVSFALGTDTAGSGRVPAAFNNVVGMKPSKGLVSTRGVVPACRTLDCVSIFALTAHDAQQALSVASGFDPRDAFSRRVAARAFAPAGFRFGVPARAELEFFGDDEAARLFEQAVEHLTHCGGTRVEIDFGAFREAAGLLYAGPWVAERLSVLESLLEVNPEAIHHTVRGIVSAAGRHSAVDTFRALYRLAELRRAADAEWERMDLLLLPTTGTTYTRAQVEADPVRLNSNLGYYTNFVNLLDLSAVAVPAGFRSGGLPSGVTLMAQAGADEALLRLASQFHRTQNLPAGATNLSVAELPGLRDGLPDGHVEIAVVGAHLSGQPLNHQLTGRGAYLRTSTRTSREYRLYALPGTQPPKPGLVREPDFEGPGIEVEVWAMPAAEFGRFVAAIPPPLTIGTVTLHDGSHVKCFLCEPHAAAAAPEITGLGGWRSYLAQQGR